MRVSGTRVERALQQRTYPVDRASHPPTSERAGLQATPAYKLTISPMAREVAIARLSAAETPAARAEKVAAVRDAIDRGTYAPTGRAIAQKIMEVIGLVPRSQ